MVSANALILVRVSEATRGFATTLPAVDRATGRQLWTRPQTSILGARDGLVVVEEMPDPGRIIEVTEGQAPDLIVNRAANGPPAARNRAPDMGLWLTWQRR
jgi:hypothetical protein